MGNLESKRSNREQLRQNVIFAEEMAHEEEQSEVLKAEQYLHSRGFRVLGFISHQLSLRGKDSE